MHGCVPYMVWEYGNNGGFGLLRIHRTGGAKQATTVYFVHKQFQPFEGQVASAHCRCDLPRFLARALPVFAGEPGPTERVPRDTSVDPSHEYA